MDSKKGKIAGRILEFFALAIILVLILDLATHINGPVNFLLIDSLWGTGIALLVFGYYLFYVNSKKDLIALRP